MTLEEAIAEVAKMHQIGADWLPRDFTYKYAWSLKTAKAYATILNAVASGDLIPVQCCMCGKTGLSVIEDGGQECQMDDGRWTCSRECWEKASGDLILKPDARLAVALAWQKAGDACGQPNGPWLASAHDCRTTILAQADQDALAEVQALKADRDTIAAARDTMGNLWAKEAAERQVAEGRAEAAGAEVARLQSLLLRYAMNVCDAEGVSYAMGGRLTDSEAAELNAMIDAAYIQEATPAKGDTP